MASTRVQGRSEPEKPLVDIAVVMPRSSSWLGPQRLGEHGSGARQPDITVATGVSVASAIITIGTGR